MGKYDKSKKFEEIDVSKVHEIKYKNDDLTNIKHNKDHRNIDDLMAIYIILVLKSISTDYPASTDCLEMVERLTRQSNYMTIKQLNKECNQSI